MFIRGKLFNTLSAVINEGPVLTNFIKKQSSKKYHNYLRNRLWRIYRCPILARSKLAADALQFHLSSRNAPKMGEITYNLTNALHTIVYLPHCSKIPNAPLQTTQAASPHHCEMLSPYFHLTQTLRYKVITLASPFL